MMQTVTKYAKHVLAAIVTTFIWAAASAQQTSVFVIEPLPIEVSASRTVSISFPSAIKAVDRGSAELLAQKAKAAENVLLIKAASQTMKPTSLIVITAGGQVHNFQVSYQESPSAISVQLLPTGHEPSPAIISGQTDQGELEESLQLAMNQSPNIRLNSRAGKLAFNLDGLYIKDGLILFRLNLENLSPIDYDAETMRVYVRDKKQVKRGAIQQEEIVPVGSASTISQVKSGDHKTIVIAIPKLTLPKGKRLSISFTEQNGARHLQIDVNPRKLSNPFIL